MVRDVQTRGVKPGCRLFLRVTSLKMRISFSTPLRLSTTCTGPGLEFILGKHCCASGAAANILDNCGILATADDLKVSGPWFGGTPFWLYMISRRVSGPKPLLGGLCHDFL